MASLDYFTPETEDDPEPSPAGTTSSAAPSGPRTLSAPALGSATGAPDRPTATGLAAPVGNAAQNGTGFVGVQEYFAPNAEAAAQSTEKFLGDVTEDTIEGVSGPGGIIGQLQSNGDPAYSAGMAGLDAYLMGRGGVEKGIKDLKDYFAWEPDEPPEEREPTKPRWDPKNDETRRYPKPYEGY